MEAPIQEDCDRLLAGNLKGIVEGIARSERFSDFSLEVSRASSKGDNYLGLILRVRISGRRDGKDLESTSVIVKRGPENKERRAFLEKIFSNEAFMYGEVLLAFRDLQKEIGVPEDEAFSGTARWYASDASDGNVAVVLEDMSARGYRLGDRLTGLDPAHCRLVLRLLGRFHALSFAMRDQRPLELQRLRSGLTETIFMNGNEQLTGHFQKMVDFTSSLLLKKFTAESKYMKRFQEFGASYMERMIDIVQGETAEPYAVISHGDCWTNNYLFKYAEDGETPVDVCLLDLQLSRYSSPMTDISYFLYSCTQGHIRREVYKSLLSDYYDSFSQFLKSLGSDPEKMFPYSAFKEHERKFSEFGLGMATMVLAGLTAPKEDVIDPEDPNGHSDDFLEKRAADDRLLERMSDIVEDMVNNDFI